MLIFIFFEKNNITDILISIIFGKEKKNIFYSTFVFLFLPFLFHSFSLCSYFSNFMPKLMSFVFKGFYFLSL